MRVGVRGGNFVDLIFHFIFILLVDGNMVSDVE